MGLLHFSSWKAVQTNSKFKSYFWWSPGAEYTKDEVWEVQTTIEDFEIVNNGKIAKNLFLVHLCNSLHDSHTFLPLTSWHQPSGELNMIQMRRKGRGLPSLVAHWAMPNLLWTFWPPARLRHEHRDDDDKKHLGENQPVEQPPIA